MMGIWNICQYYSAPYVEKWYEYQIIESNELNILQGLTIHNDKNMHKS